MGLRSLLKPTKEKIVIDSFLSLLWFAYAYLTPETGLSGWLHGQGILNSAFIAALNLTVFLIMFYPLSCGIHLLYEALARKARTTGRDLVIAILFILLINPLTVTALMYSISYMNAHVLNHPCGIEVAGFRENSPSEKAGMRIGEVISSIDGEEVDTLESLLHVLGKKSPGDKVAVKTVGSVYEVALTQNPQNSAPSLGVVIKQRYCSSI